MPPSFRFVVVLVLTGMLLGQCLYAESGTGAICVVPVSPEPPTRFSPGLHYNPVTLFLRVDKRPPIAWSHTREMRIDGLGTDTRHLFVVISDRKPLQSLWFRFSDYKSNQLCFFFDGYGGVQVLKANRKGYCRCN